MKNFMNLGDRAQELADIIEQIDEKAGDAFRRCSDLVSDLDVTGACDVAGIMNKLAERATIGTEVEFIAALDWRGRELIRRLAAKL